MFGTTDEPEGAKLVGRESEDFPAPGATPVARCRCAALWLDCCLIAGYLRLLAIYLRQHFKNSSATIVRRR